jgi:glycosyltransferase involved in cell wall biosynthesis
VTSLEHQPGISEPDASTADGKPLKLLSVVAPVYNEEATIEQFYSRVCSALQGLQFEIVLVDDGSTDGSDAELRKLASNEPR